MKYFVLLTTFLWQAQISFLLQGQQSIRGNVIDQDSKVPIPGTNIIIIDYNPILGATTDSNGQYVINGVATGRHTLKVTSVGYEEIMSTNVWFVRKTVGN